MSTENRLLFTPYVGASEQGGWGGKGLAPLELGIYIVNNPKDFVLLILMLNVVVFQIFISFDICLVLAYVQVFPW